MILIEFKVYALAIAVGVSPDTITLTVSAG
jgi:hypothetical protein